MMRTTREPLSQVAIVCGMCDQAYLCKMFHRLIGMSHLDGVGSSRRAALITTSRTAFANALADAIGVRLRDIPRTPRKVKAAIGLKA